MNKIVSDPPYLLRSALSHEGCGYLPIGYLPTGYLPTGYLPIGAAATGGGSLRGKSAAAATLSMATSPAVTIMTIFMMLIPLCWAPGRADRVTPLFPFFYASPPLLPSHFPAQSPGDMAPDYLSLWRSIGSNAIVGSGSSRTTAGWPAVLPPASPTKRSQPGNG